ncbi:hypothetical protein MMC20_000118 [Loxospora ochrophaea]|nr:hypothetical protein [Loxospora ochrophaea]
MSLWDSLFTHVRQPVAQILLTRNDIADVSKDTLWRIPLGFLPHKFTNYLQRTQYLNAQNTFVELFNMGVIPIVNENDTLAVTEIKFGDNDTLSAITAAMVQADYLFLMTDVDCLYDKNPRTHPDAQPIEVVSDISTLAADVSSAGSTLGTGGMSTKIVAARLATSAGVTTVITRSSNPGNIINILQHASHTPASSSSILSLPADPASDPLSHPLSSSLHLADHPSPLHTRFLPSPSPIRDRRFWLLHGLSPHGTIYIDQGAHRALLGKAGLLPVGIVDVEGPFAQQEAVRLVVVKRHTAFTSTSGPSPISTPTDFTSASRAPLLYEVFNPAPREVGRAVVNYSAAEVARIKGLQSTEIGNALGYADSEYVALRENISLVKGSEGGTAI